MSTDNARKEKGPAVSSRPLDLEPVNTHESRPRVLVLA
jgi:hypothetical protein